MCDGDEGCGWRVTGEVTMQLEAVMDVDERPSQDHIINTFKGGYWGTTTKGIGYEVTGIKPACDETDAPAGEDTTADSEDVVVRVHHGGRFVEQQRMDEIPDRGDTYEVSGFEFRVDEISTGRDETADAVITLTTPEPTE